MNGKQTTPQTGSAGPIVAIIGLGITALYGLLSADESKKEPEIQPTNAGTENNGKPVVKPVVSNPVRLKPKTNFPLILKAETPFPAQFKRKRIRRKNMEIIFRQGELNLTEAVSALKGFGFGKSAAYEALSVDGQFSAWLKFAPDGMISWKY
jgi:hypothetical protein